MKKMKKLFKTLILILCIFISISLVSTLNRTTSMSENELEFYYHYTILKVSDKPLFRADGSVNHEVFQKLMEILGDPRLNPAKRDKKAAWPTGMPFTYTPYVAVTAEDFSNFVVPVPTWRRMLLNNGFIQRHVLRLLDLLCKHHCLSSSFVTCMSKSGAVAIKLFETIPDRTGVEHGHLTEFTSQWWRIVYRSTDAENDVLTLWMMQPYRLSPFSGTRYDALLGRADERFIDRESDRDTPWARLSAFRMNTIFSDWCIAHNFPPSDGYFFENNFSASIARSNLLRDLRSLLSHFDVARYLVAPKNLPGRWQSSRYQTGTNQSGLFYATGEFQVYRRDYPGSTDPAGGLGATGLIWGTHRHFSLINGKDGLSIGPHNNHWPHSKLTPTHYDLLWLPSDFEVRTMGRGKDNALFQTFIRDPDNPATDLRWNYRVRRNDRRQDLSGGRSGLWRLNGFDRAFNADALGLPRGWESQLVWLRSVDGLGLGNANTVYHTGNRYGYGVNQLAGMRPAIHLSITRLSE